MPKIIPVQDPKIFSRENLSLPAIITDVGEKAWYRFVEFFTAEIRNKNTRSAYSIAIKKFFTWCEYQNLSLFEITSVHAAAYFEQLPGSIATKKQNHTAIRKLFDYLVVGQVVPFNPITPVKIEKLKPRKGGKTPLLDDEEVAAIFNHLTRVIVTTPPLICAPNTNPAPHNAFSLFSFAITIPYRSLT